jgi:3-deoxy-D-manno-octulosonic-acid transferase
MLDLYTKITGKSDKLLNKLLEVRLQKGKEDTVRIHEKRGQASQPRPNGSLIWLHAASVGESQSALILIDRLSSELPNAHFLVTSGTLTSAELMNTRLPDNAIHQFYPLDHPGWTTAFLNHWKPDLIFWMESELWPNMLTQIKARNIPAVLVNARLSQKSFTMWNIFKSTAKKLLSNFSLILTQTQSDEQRFKKLGAQNIHTTDNLKYSAAPLPVIAEDFKQLKTSINSRPIWVYASTHKGEELLACKIHDALKQKISDILTIIVPRHPERHDDISKTCKLMKLNTVFRTINKQLIDTNTDIYVADTLGELGLFYQLSDIAMIGRSFSDDGGGGHNPIEAAQLDCCVLTGPNIQYQSDLFEEMFAVNAAYQMEDKMHLLKTLRLLFEDTQTRKEAIERAQKFAQSKTGVINIVMEHITPFIKPLKSGYKDAI